MRGIDLGRTLLLRRVPCKPAFDKSAVMRSLIVLSYIYLKASLDRYIKQQKTPSSVSFISLGLRSEGDSDTILQYINPCCMCFLCNIIRIYNEKWDRLYIFTFPIISYYPIDPISVQLFYAKNAPNFTVFLII